MDIEGTVTPIRYSTFRSSTFKKNN